MEKNASVHGIFDDLSNIISFFMRIPYLYLFWKKPSSAATRLPYYPIDQHTFYYICYQEFHNFLVISLPMLNSLGESAMHITALIVSKSDISRYIIWPGILFPFITVLQRTCLVCSKFQRFQLYFKGKWLQGYFMATHALVFALYFYNFHKKFDTSETCQMAMFLIESNVSKIENVSITEHYLNRTASIFELVLPVFSLTISICVIGYIYKSPSMPAERQKREIILVKQHIPIFIFPFIKTLMVLFLLAWRTQTIIPVSIAKYILCFYTGVNENIIPITYVISNFEQVRAVLKRKRTTIVPGSSATL